MVHIEEVSSLFRTLIFFFFLVYVSFRMQIGFLKWKPRKLLCIVNNEVLNEIQEVHERITLHTLNNSDETNFDTKQIIYLWHYQFQTFCDKTRYWDM